MGCSVPSVSQQLTSNWMADSHGSNPEGPQQAGEMGTLEPHKVQEVKLCTWEGTNLGINPCWSSGKLEGSFCIKGLRSPKLHSLTQSSKESWWCLVCIRQSTISTSKEIILLVCSTVMSHTWSGVYSSGLLSTRQTWTYWRVSKKDHGRWQKEWRTGWEHWNS